MAVSGIGSTPGIGRINPSDSNRVSKIVNEGLKTLKAELPGLYSKALENSK